MQTLRPVLVWTRNEEEEEKSRFTRASAKCMSGCISRGALIVRRDSNEHKTAGAHEAHAYDALFKNTIILRNRPYVAVAKDRLLVRRTIIA